MLANTYIRNTINFLLLISISFNSFANSKSDVWNDEIKLYSELVESYYNICFDEKGKFLKDTIVYEGNNQIDCNKQAKALQAHLHQIEELSKVDVDFESCVDCGACGIRGGAKQESLASVVNLGETLSAENQVPCKNGESDSECFSSIACNAMMSFNISSNISVGLSKNETYLKYSEKFYSLLGLDIKKSKSLKFLQSCAEKQSSTCLLNLLRGVWDSVWGLIDVAWEIVKYAGKKIKDGYNYVVDSIGSWFSNVEDKTSEKMMLASQVDDSMLDKFLKDPLGVVSEIAGVLYDSMVKGIREHYGCEKWSGIPFTSQCLKPMSNWDCATCGQKMNAICGVVGFAAGEIVTAFFTGGVAAAAKVGVTSSVKIGAKITTKMGKALSKIPKVDDTFKVIAKGSQKVANGMGHLSDVAYKSWLKLKDSFAYNKLKEALAAIKKSASSAKKTVPYKIMAKTTKIALSPISKYLKLMDKAFGRGFKQTSKAMEKVEKILNPKAIYVIEEGHKINLLTKKSYEAMPDGTKFYDINGKEYIKGVSEISDDTRKGFLAYGKLTEKSEKTVQKLSDGIKQDLHAEWRKGFQASNGKEVKRLKPIPEDILKQGEKPEEALRRLKSEGFEGLELENGVLVQNINQEAGKLVPSLNHKLNGALADDYALVIQRVNLNTKNDIESAASEIHDIWMKHNSWQKDSNPHLFVAYKDLTDYEKAKDLVVLESSLKVKNPELANTSAFKDYKSNILKNALDEEISLVLLKKPRLNKTFNSNTKIFEEILSNSRLKRNFIDYISSASKDELIAFENLVEELRIMKANPQYPDWVNKTKKLLRKECF